MTEKGQQEIDRVLSGQSKKFHAQLVKKEFPAPSFWWLMVFMMGRTSIQKMLDDTWRDFTFYRGKGWFESEYFYPVKLNVMKRLSGKLFDKLALRIIRS